MTDIIQQVKRLYEDSNYRNIIHDINNVYIPLNFSWKRIGVSSSGGADSTLLAFILCKLIQDNNLDIELHIIHNIRLWKTRPWQKYVSLKIYNELQSKFPNIKFIRHENFIPPEFEWGSKGPTMYDEYGNFKSGNQIELRAHAEYIGYTYKLDSWYCAVTKNPSDNNIKGGLIDRDFKLSKDNNLDRFIKIYLVGYSCHPFTHVEKDWIVGRYKELEIMDLFKMTRSCEGEFDGLNYRTYKEGMDIPECGKCFWCKEREWGILNAK
jgi:hypothetical protein